MTNPETGKPKGFGFADFADADAAASAVRNLNDFEINGRKIRVDWPHNNEKDSVPQDYVNQNPPPQQQQSIQQAQLDGQGAPSLPPLPPGTDLPPSLRCADAISQTLNTLPPQQLLDVLTQMKQLVVSDPSRATELLKQAPQLSYAIFQALILMNLVDPQVLGQVVQQTTQQSQPQPQQPQQPLPPPPQISQAYPPPQPVPTPQQHYQQPPPVQQQPQLALSGAMGQEEMLRQVLAMDQATIDSLPPVERGQIMALRAQLGVR